MTKQTTTTNAAGATQPDTAQQHLAAARKFHDYILTADGKGEYLRDSFTTSCWDTTPDFQDAKIIRASSPRRAIDRFCREAGLSIRYRGGDWSVTDRNLHGFSLGLLSDALDENKNAGSYTHHVNLDERAGQTDPVILTVVLANGEITSALTLAPGARLATEEELEKWTEECLDAMPHEYDEDEK